LAAEKSGSKPVPCDQAAQCRPPPPHHRPLGLGQPLTKIFSAGQSQSLITHCKTVVSSSAFSLVKQPQDNESEIFPPS